MSSISRDTGFATNGAINTAQITGKILEDSNKNTYVLGLTGSISTTGTVSTATMNGYVLHSFTTSGSIAFPHTVTCPVLIVGGGGGGGFWFQNEGPGGGGGGGVGVGNLTFIGGTTYTITVGAGGNGGNVTSTGNSANIAQNGGNSSIIGGTINEIAIGGGGGRGTSTSSYNVVGSGGSGGGACRYGGTDYARLVGRALKAANTTLTYYGNEGGNCVWVDGGNGQGGGGGGGGGAMETGVSNNSDNTIHPNYPIKPGYYGNNGQHGGDGYVWPINGTAYGGGGGGGGTGYAASLGGNGGLGGGGKGCGFQSSGFVGSDVSVSGTPNTGGGGGGGIRVITSAFESGNGGSGIVIIAVPSYFPIFTVPQSKFLLAKYTNFGTLDTTFNSTGYIQLQSQMTNLTNAETNYDMVIYPTGKLAVGFYSSTDTKTYINIISPAGRIDVSFNINYGTVYTNMVMGLSPTNSNVYILQSVGTGSAILTQTDSAANYAVTSLSSSYRPLAMAFDSGGNLYATSDTSTIYSYTSTGAANTGFNSTGSYSVSATKPSSRLSSILIQPDGKIVVAGSYPVSNSYRSYIFRLSQSGVPDSTLSGSGTGYSYEITNGNNYIYSASYLSNGKVLVAGGNSIVSGAGGSLLMALYNSTGSADTYTDTSQPVRNCMVQSTGGLLASVNGSVIKYNIAGITSGYTSVKNTNNYQISSLFSSTNSVYPTATNVQSSFDGNYTYYTFTQTSGTILFPSNTVASVLVVGGGGGGGNVSGTPLSTSSGGGGSAGEMVIGTVMFGANTTYNITVGSGGSPGTNGTSSQISASPTLNVIAAGGRAGGSATSGVAGGNGGSTVASGTYSGMVSYVSYVNNGGLATTSYGGGGGGAGEVGGNNYGAIGNLGYGGNGVSWPINKNFYAGGGGGGQGLVSSSLGGAGGGGNGGFRADGSASGGVTGGNGTANTGGGGGGARRTATNTSYSGGSGGSGIVIIAIKNNSESTLTMNGLGALQPTGSIVAYLGTKDPPGWVICDGQTRTSSDNRFVSVLSLGMGSGTSYSYTPPDFRGAFLRGTGTNGAYSTYAGPSVNSSQLDEIKTHTHNIIDPGHNHMNQVGLTDNKDFLALSGAKPPNDSSTGSNFYWVGESAMTSIRIQNYVGTETRPFNYGVNWILKL